MKEFVFVMGKECVLFEVATELGLEELFAPIWSSLATMEQLRKHRRGSTGLVIFFL
jgi:hypothetical protein